jgi:hypothetical protein
MIATLAIASWFLTSAGVGLFANALGRTGVAWTVFSIFFSPSLGLIVVALLDKKVPSPKLQKLHARHLS